MTKRTLFRLLAVLVVLAAACGDDGEGASDDDAATRSAEGSGFFSDLGDRAGPEDDEDEELDATTTTTTSTTVPSPRDPKPTGVPVLHPTSRLAANDEVTIPEGDPGQVSVVLTGQPQSGSLGVVVRNNTEQPVFDVEVGGTAHDPDGSQVGSSPAYRLVNPRLDPGEWSFALLYFEGSELPEGATYDLTVTSSAEPGIIPTADMLPIELDQVDGSPSRQIVGVVQNDSDVTVSGPISVDAACFDATGTELLSMHLSYTHQNELAPGATSTFSMNLFGAECPIYVVGASGYSW